MAMQRSYRGSGNVAGIGDMIPQKAFIGSNKDGITNVIRGLAAIYGNYKQIPPYLRYELFGDKVAFAEDQNSKAPMLNPDGSRRFEPIDSESEETDTSDSAVTTGVSSTDGNDDVFAGGLQTATSKKNDDEDRAFVKRITEANESFIPTEVDGSSAIRENTSKPREPQYANAKQERFNQRVNTRGFEEGDEYGEDWYTSPGVEYWYDQSGDFNTIK